MSFVSLENLNAALEGSNISPSIEMGRRKELTDTPPRKKGRISFFLYVIIVYYVTLVTI